jgi:D-alanyl-D-alanine-carboxypeptidase/D-alanyl-D-alanine-endopeptidase
MATSAFIDEALGPDLFLQSGATGMVLAVVRNNQVFFRGIRRDGARFASASDTRLLLRLCSLTKIFTTDVFTKLVLDKTVQLDDPLQCFAPPHTVASKRIQAITLADLATHTSGLPHELSNAPRDTPHFTFPDYRIRWH